MRNVTGQKIKVELLWWLFTLILVLAVMAPIWIHTEDYPFYIQNIFFIVAFVTFTRYIFLLSITPIARLKWIKVFIIAIAAIMFFVMSTGLSDFHNFMEQRGLQTLVDDLHVTRQTRIINYIKSEMIFFGVGSIIAGLLLPVRMMMSLWRMRHKGTV